MTAWDFWRFSVFSVWFGVMVAVFSLSMSRACSFCAWTLTSPQGLGWCEPQSQKWIHTVRVFARLVFQYLRQLLRRLLKYSLWMMLGGVFSPLLSMCQQATALQFLNRSNNVCHGQVFGLCLLIMIKVTHIRLLSGSACVQFPPFFLKPIS